MKVNVDLIIVCRWLCPVVPKNILLSDHAVIMKSGIIIDICSYNETEKYHARETVHLKEHILIPGLINLHTHAAMSLMRGLADDVALMPWLQQHIWPAEKKFVSPSFVYEGSILAIAEMLAGGITTFNDMYFFPESAAEAAIKMGMRGNLGLVVLEFPTNYANDADSYIQKGLEARDHWRDEALISFSLAPHAPYTVADATFERIMTLADQVGISVHTHMHETLQEIADSEQQYGLRPLNRFANLDMLSPNLTLAHCVHLNDVLI
jgi:5-methylthioadenosine/S-adenosylhomocysteine deaminase